MRTVLRYLKPYWINVVLIIVFLFIQANADLSLPDYLSNIVNIGIQQNGIQADLPPVMRTSTFAAFDKLFQIEGKPEYFQCFKKSILK